MKMETGFLTNVFKCRICGSIIPTEECAESHGEDCRPVSHKTKRKSMKSKQITEITFPCPRVVLHKLPCSNLSEETLTEFLALGKPKPTYSTLTPYHRELTTDERIERMCRKVVMGLHWDPRLRDVRHEIRNLKTVKIPTKEKVEEFKAKKEEKRRKRENRLPKPYLSYTCPLKTCRIKLGDKTQLKSHFIMHLDNNPWACPLPGCNVKLDSQLHFKRHFDWHMGHLKYICCERCGHTSTSPSKDLAPHNCFPQNPKPDVSKRSPNAETSYGRRSFLKSHYEYLVERGLLIGNQEINVNFDYKFDMNYIINIDPVFLQVCRENPGLGFWDLLFGGEQLPSTSLLPSSTGQHSQRIIPEAFGGNEQSSTSSGEFNLQKIISSMDVRNLVAHIKCPETNDKVVVETPQERPSRFPDIDNEPEPESDAEDIAEMHSFQPDNPYACPFKRCGAKLGSKIQLKTHFIIHLKKNPYACPIRACKVRLDAQCEFKHHMEWHLGQDQEKSNKAKVSIRRHYADLRSRGLLLEESEEHKLKFDFKYKVDIDTIIQTDPGFLKVCEGDPCFYDRLFGDEQQHPSTSTLRQQKINDTSKNDDNNIPAERLNAPKASKNDMFRFRKKLENGDYLCSLCEFISDTEIGFERHWNLQHSFEMDPFKSGRYPHEKVTISEITSSYLSNDAEDIGKVVATANQPDNSYDCPLKRCHVNLGSRKELKSHFIHHLKRNPYACPIPDCEYSFNAQWKFKYHMERHMGLHRPCPGNCGEIFSVEDKLWNHPCFREERGQAYENLKMESDRVKGLLCKHYVNLKSKGLLLEDTADFSDFTYVVDIDRVIETDPVFLQVCKYDTGICERLLGGDDASQRIMEDINPTGTGSMDSNDDTFTMEMQKALENSLRVQTLRDLPDEETANSSQVPSGKNVQSERNNEGDASNKKNKMSNAKETDKEKPDCNKEVTSAPAPSSPASEKRKLPNDGIVEMPKGADDFQEEGNLNTTTTTEHESTKSHDAPESDLYLNKLKNGKYKCTKCKFTTKSEAVGKRHCLVKHKSSESSKDLPVKSKSSPKRPRKPKFPKDLIPDTNVKAVKVEQELDLGLSIIVPKQEEADCELNIKPEVLSDHIKEEDQDIGSISNNNGEQPSTSKLTSEPSQVTMKNKTFKEDMYSQESNDIDNITQDTAKFVEERSAVDGGRSSDPDTSSGVQAKPRSTSSKKATTRVSKRRTKKVAKKVKNKREPSKIKYKDSNSVLLDEEIPHCSKKSAPKQSRKRKFPKDPIPDSNVKAVKVEPELHLGLSVIVPKEEEAEDCELDIKSEIKEEDLDTVATATSSGTVESLVNFDSSSVNVKPEPELILPF